MNKIVVIHKNALEAVPPVLSLVLSISDLGYQVTLMTCSIQDKNKALLHKCGVNTTVLPFTSMKSIVGKVIDIVKFRFAVYKKLKTIDTKDSILILEGGNTIFALGTGYKRRGFKYIIFLPELLENVPYQRRAVKRVIHESQSVLIPEYNRSYIAKIWYNLQNRPIVLPNKPYFEPTDYNKSDLLERFHDIIDVFKQKKVILYQGHVSKSRDISVVIRAVKELGNGFQVVLMGKDYGIVDEYKTIDSGIIHIPFIPAPDYLVLTRMAYIGILVYTPDMFNTVFCAPNKIFEYTKYGLPVLGNDIPGLRYPLTLFQMGEIADFNDINSVQEAIRRIDCKYDEYRNNALKYYNSVDNKETLRKVLERIK